MSSVAVPLYFGPPDASLFGWYHPAAHGASGLAVVLCGPLGAEQVSAYRSLRHLALALAQAGVPVLRFDYHGTGDSEGSDWQPGRVPAWRASVGHAVAEVRRLSGATRVALVGLRLGALLATLAAAERDDVEALVLWAPLGSGHEFERETRMLAALGDSDTRLPDGGLMSPHLALTAGTIAELAALDLSSLGHAPAPRALVIPRDDVVPADAARVATRLRGLGVALEERPLPGYAEMVKLPHDAGVPRQAIAAITAWLVAQRGTPARRDTPALSPRVLQCAGSPAPPLERLLPPATDAVEERPFHADGGRLFGILATPDGTRSPARPLIVLVNAGAVPRTGPNRLHVTLARLWAARGFPVLRLDLGGLGDSRPAAGLGENDPYSPRAVDDVARAIETARSQLGTGAAVVMGLCSGAHTAFHAGLELDTIAAAVLVNPVVFHWQLGDSLELEAYRSHDAARYYRARLLDPDAWRRLLLGEVQVAAAVRDVLARGREVARSAFARSLRALGARPDPHDAGEALRRLVRRGTDVVLLFSRDEPGLDFLVRRHRADLRELGREPRFALHVLPEPGHTLGSLAAQCEAADRLTRFLLGRFSSGGSAMVGAARSPTVQSSA